MSWKEIIKDLKNLELTDVMSKLSQYAVYPRSVYKKDGSILFMGKVEGEKKLFIVNQSQIFDEFSGQVENISGL